MLEDWILRKKEVEASKSKLRGIDLSKSSLVEADLTQAVLSEANLSDADLEGAELMDSYLHGANLKGVVHLTCDQIELANFDKDTVFPDYITIHWTEDGYCECQEQ